MFGKNVTTLYVLFLLSCLSASLAYTQASINVSTLDPVYRDIDKLVAHGLVDKIIVGQRPYSRKEIARITSEAMKHLPRLEDKLNDPKLSEEKKEAIQERLDYLRPILDRLKQGFQEELVLLKTMEGDSSWYSLHLLEKVTADFTGSNSKARVAPPNNGIGSINAVINPLLQYQQGRELIEGVNPSLETTHWARLTNHFAIYLQPRFQLAFATGENEANNNNIFLLYYYGKVYFKNFELEVGRDSLAWGQGKDVGLLLSNNPRGLDMIKLSNDSPFLLPSFLKYLGPGKFSYFFSTLGPQQNFSYPYLLGYKFSIEPLSFFELGFSMLVESGGKGSPSASFGKRVLEGLPFGALANTSELLISNLIGGLDFRFRIPPARNLEIYGEIAPDDSPKLSRTYDLFILDSALMGGVYLGRLTNSGRADLRMEYHRTGPILYRHSQFTSGLTLNGFILGDNLGPNAQGFYLTSNFDINQQNLLTFDQAIELRSGDIWSQNGDGHSTPQFVVTQNNPSENRYRTTVSWLHRMESKLFLLKTKVGYEFVQNFNFMNSKNRNNFLGEIGIQFDFDYWKTKKKTKRSTDLKFDQ